MTQKIPQPRVFGKIILTLENCLIPDAKLDETPSSQDGLDKETEMDLRILGCELIQTAGILLKLPQVIINKCAYCGQCLVFGVTDSNFDLFNSGRDGYRTGIVTEIFLLKVIRAA